MHGLRMGGNGMTQAEYNALCITADARAVEKSKKRGEVMEKKIVVPSGMVDAAYGKAIEDEDGKVRYSPVDAVKSHERLGVERILEAALRWLSENPIEPTQKQSRKLYADVPQGLLVDEVPSWYAIVWQRRMFLAPESEVPEEIKDLLWSIGGTWMQTDKKHNNEVAEAYRRGKEAK